MNTLVRKGLEASDNKTVKNTLDLAGLFFPKLRTAKRGFMAIRNLIFKEELKKIEEEKLKKLLSTEEGTHLILQIYEACMRSKKVEQAKLFMGFFKTITDNADLDQLNFDELEEYIRLISGLTYREILALHKIREFTLQNPKLVENDKRGFDPSPSFIKPSFPWQMVTDYLEQELNVKDIPGFLGALSNSQLIKKMGNVMTYYISTEYFEILFNIMPDLEEYLEGCEIN